MSQMGISVSISVMDGSEAPDADAVAAAVAKIDGLSDAMIRVSVSTVATAEIMPEVELVVDSAQKDPEATP